MKLSVFLILSCLCIYASCVKEQVWGDTSHNVREIGTETVVVPSTMLQVKTHVLHFPRVPLVAPIAGIRHLDKKSHPVQIRFLKGGIGYNNVSIEITSQRGHGINSEFTFYAR
ncbi:uncharacterized protein LOC116349416 [Contarinia nasturtii]|uniref:uncharacterized protein LOC116349416 n=1 Tax=Contarinia nasturtii TaxID=265458 RepID=UPI0012D3E1DA|nr:uncharacterized protein LOC116349416 [Contarinia nasturtii]